MHGVSGVWPDDGAVGVLAAEQFLFHLPQQCGTDRASPRKSVIGWWKPFGITASRRAALMTCPERSCTSRTIIARRHDTAGRPGDRAQRQRAARAQPAADSQDGRDIRQVPVTQRQRARTGWHACVSASISSALKQVHRQRVPHELRDPHRSADPRLAPWRCPAAGRAACPPAGYPPPAFRPAAEPPRRPPPHRTTDHYPPRWQSESVTSRRQQRAVQIKPAGMSQDAGYDRVGPAK